MKKLIALLALLVAPAVWAAENTLHLFIWSEYIDPAVVADFEKSNHCKVVIDLYEDAESMLSKVQAAGGGTFDVVVPPDHIVTPMVKLKLLSPLRKETLSNLKHIDSKFLKPPFDPENTFTVPYQWGTAGIYAHVEKGKTLAPTWGLIFDPK